jgi:hypothetical protein
MRKKDAINAAAHHVAVIMRKKDAINAAAQLTHVTVSHWNNGQWKHSSKFLGNSTQTILIAATILMYQS